MAEELKARSEVDENLTWDLSLLYKDEDALWADVKKMQELAAEIKSVYCGKLNDAKQIVACLEEYIKVMEIVSLVDNYGFLAVEVDYFNGKNQENSTRITNAVSGVDSELSFIASEISMQSEEVLTEALELAKGCKNYLKEILRMKPHMVHPEAERVLAALNPVIQAPFDIYNMIKLADMDFQPFEVNGVEYPLGYSLFEDHYEYEPDTEIRRAAYAAFSKKLAEYANGTAAVYNAHVQQEKIVAKLRGFGSQEEMNLFYDHVTLPMYHRQIDLIMEKLAPHMRKYAKLIQKVHGLEKMTYADLKLPLDPGYSPKVSIEEAKQYVKDGLAIMGEEYGAMLDEALENRWIDFAQNKGKSTGGFCASPYRKPSFILMSWHGEMSDVFTLVHELGHAGHFKLCNEAQVVTDADVSRYFVEAPSTMNEMLFSHHLLKTNEDKRFRRWVLSNMVGNTYYHNCVTHLLEAAYQREVLRIVEAGGSVQAETLNQIMKETLERFWGDAVELTPGAELTWMRQPHYYMGLYSYTYSAGLTVATQMCKRIEREGDVAVEDWKKVLTAGSSLAPLELAALGGVDISTDAALLDTIETIGAYIDEMILLTEAL